MPKIAKEETSKGTVSKFRYATWGDKKYPIPNEVTADGVRELYYQVVGQALKDVTDADPLVEADAKRFIFGEDTGFDAMCVISGLRADDLRAGLRDILLDMASI